jgi:hypothetical protein
VSAREADGEPHRMGGGGGCDWENPVRLWLRARAARIEGEGEPSEELKDVSETERPSSDAEGALGSLSTGIEEGEGGYLKVRVAARGVMGGYILRER